MHLVLRYLNPGDDNTDFVSDYIDDILVFSETLADHLEHLRSVLTRLLEANLKLKPIKCRFVQDEVQYLGLVISREGVKPNPAKTVAVKEFPVLQNVKAVRQFLGLASYYHRFVRGFAKI